MFNRFLIAGIIFLVLTVCNALARYLEHDALAFMLNPWIATVLYAVALNIVFLPWLRGGLMGIVREALIILAAFGLSCFFIGI